MYATYIGCTASDAFVLYKTHGKCSIRPRARGLGKRGMQVVTRVHGGAAAMRSRSDLNMNRLRRSDECLRTSQHTDVLRCLIKKTKNTLHTLEKNVWYCLT